MEASMPCVKRNTSSFTATIARYIGCSLVLNRSLRRMVIKLAEEKEKSLAPELGLDMASIVRVSYLLEKKDRKFQYILAGMTILFLVVLIVAFNLKSMALAIGLTIGFALITGMIRYQNQKMISGLLSHTDHLSPTALLDIEKHLLQDFNIDKDIRPLPDEQQNLVVYSGFRPFVGAGEGAGSWSFPINVSRPKDEIGVKLEMSPFELSELYDRLTENLERAGFSQFQSNDFLFINGTEIRTLDWVLPDITGYPLLSVDKKYIEKYQSENDPIIRYYKWFQSADRNGDIVLSYFLRILRQGNHLYIEANRYIAGPLTESCREIDTRTEPEIFADLFSNSIVGPFAAVSSFFHIVSKCVNSFWKLIFSRFSKRRRLRKIMRNPKFDYGTRTSLRSAISTKRFRRFDAQMDLSQHLMIFEKVILETITKFLDEHNIDTSELEERQQTILNSGIILQGGAVTAKSLAVGENAESSSVQS